MAEARYEILVPSKTVAKAAAQYLHMTLKIPVHIDGGRSVFEDGQQRVYDVVVVSAEDTPQTDSQVKQAAAYIAEVVNVETILVSKTGKDGIVSWPIRNTAPSNSTGTI
jgi:hypothetical protein